MRLVIDGSLTPFEGNVPLPEDFVHEIPVGSSTRLAVWGVETEPGARESTLRVRFSSPISAAVAEKYVRVEPAVRYRPSAERNVLSLTGEFRPGSSYTLTIGKGLPGHRRRCAARGVQGRGAPPRPRALGRLPEPGDVPLGLGQPDGGDRDVNVPRCS